MSESFVTYAPMLPEFIIILGAIVLLMYGVFGSETQTEAVNVGWLSIIVLITATVALLWAVDGSQSLFLGAFKNDSFARFMKILAIAGSICALMLAFDDFSDHGIMKFEYPVLVMFATAGMMVMISAGDLIALYIGLELQSLALYVMAAYRRDSVRSSEAGLKYFVLGALSSGILLYGASLLYGFAGSTDFQVIANAAKGTDASVNLWLIFGLVFLMVGISFKISAVPFHMWTPDVYEGSATPVTAFFATAPKVAAIALLVRVSMSAFPGIAPQWQQIITFIAIASMLFGAFAAIGQTNIKRLMAYSSISNVGFALVGLAANTAEGVQGVLIYMSIYVVMTLGVFASIVCMRRDGQSLEDIHELSGLAKNNLPLAFGLMILMFSLAGIPPLVGFFAKYHVLLAAVQAELYGLAIFGVLASVIGAYYYLRIIKIMFFDDSRDPFQPVRFNPGVIILTSALLMLVGVTILGPFVDAALIAARTLTL
ncbi:MAG: NADH-quinone oxidoreductase subunit NuoN [Hyphomicrobiaceae bacterium]|nr:NADH-quinone oxidoreductase subunit NuoN [Hyphomicrobiaceae bacterium]